MDRLRLGDVSPVAMTMDDYRAAHDVSPLSPVADEESHHPRRGASRRWRSLPNNYFDVSPVTPHPGDRDWRAAMNRRSSSVYSQDTPLDEQSAWSKEVGFGGIPQLSLRDPESIVPEEDILETGDSLHEARPELDTEGEKPQSMPTWTATGLSTMTAFPETRCQYWNPVEIRDWFLIGLAISFAVVAIVVFALYLISSRSVGLGSAGGPPGLIYLWKYIPTTVVVFLLAVWNRVDFDAKLLQSWSNLRSGPASAERSVFLDLISPTWPGALKIAVRTGSYVPILTTFGVILLNIVVIFSTALLQVAVVNVVSGEFSTTWDPGGGQDTEDRVQVKLGAAAPVITLLLVCLGLSIMVLFKRPQDVVPRDPRSIGGMALLLQCNAELSRDFRSYFQHLRHHLQHERFLTLLPHRSDFRFAIVREAMNPAFHSAVGDVQDKERPLWWKPRVLGAGPKILAILLPLALIASLESVQQVCDRSNGFVTTSVPGTAHYAYTIIPAIVMWGIGMLYGTIHFYMILLAPYKALSNGSSSDRSLFSHSLGDLPIFQLPSSLQQRHWAAAFTALATIVSPWLTIIVSGLYSIEVVGVSTTDAQSRIIQNRAPKLALQVLLGVMAICLAASWLCMRRFDLLPHNPCSIAGMAALLAGGELWKGPDDNRRGVFVRRGLDIPNGAEWMSDHELKKYGVWEDMVFGLGWWPNGRYGVDAGGRIDVR